MCVIGKHILHSETKILSGLPYSCSSRKCTLFPQMTRNSSTGRISVLKMTQNDAQRRILKVQFYSLSAQGRNRTHWPSKCYIFHLKKTICCSIWGCTFCWSNCSSKWVMLHNTCTCVLHTSTQWLRCMMRCYLPISRRCRCTLWNQSTHPLHCYSETAVL